MLIPQDKANHFFYGFVIYCLFSWSDFAIVIVILIAAGKEVYDYFDYGKFDPLDFLWTLIPAIVLNLIPLM